jgi:Carboxypeptidase regulatory-like domain/TonB-dependent Receptor Plug Domain/TonB dependent receptor
VLFLKFRQGPCLIPAVLFSLLVRLAFSQETTGTITGAVTDAQDALMQGAVLRLSNLEQGASRQATSNQQGIYQFNFLEPGRYQVTASRTGFRPVVKTDLVLTVGQTMRIDFNLQLGDVNQSITVSDTRSQMLQTESSEVSQIINATQVADLPLNGRNFDDLIPLMAGATTGMQGQSNGGYNLNGSRSDSNLFIIEGQSNNDFNNNLLIRPEIDAIQEFQILTATFSAEYGSTGGGIVSVQLKSGGNQFHASLFEFLRNDKLDANNFFANDVPLPSGQTSASREKLRRNQFGGTVGGPIVRDKTFFFMDYQGSRQVAGATTIQTVPTLLERGGNFSQDLVPGKPLYDNSFLQTIFPNQTIPASALDPAAVKLTNLYPVPNVPGAFIPGQGVVNNYSTSGIGANNNNQFDIKLDHYLGSADTLSGHYTFSQGNQLIPAAFGNGTVGPCVGCGTVLDLLAGSPQNRSQQAGLAETHIFTAATVNEFRFGVTRYWSFYQTSDGGKNLASDVGIPNVNVSAYTTGLPWFDFSPAPSWIGTSPFTPSLTAYTNWEESDSLSLLRGRHSIRLGFDMHRKSNNTAANFFGKGAYIFTPFFTGNAFADFLTGRATEIQQTLTPGTTGLRGQEYGAYIQDDFKVTPRLTLNLGLRYDLFPGAYEDYNRLSNLDPATGVVQLAGKNGAPRNFIPTDYLDFAPRFGFAYALASDTVIRGGYGISYVNANNFVSYIGANPPYTQSFTLVNLSFKNYQAINLLSQGLPTGLAPTPANFNPNQAAGNYDQAGANNRTPYTQSFGLNLQRALPGNFVVEAGYVGTKGTRLPGEVDGDPAAPGNPATQQQRRVYAAALPNVTGITDYINAFSSTYNSLQVKVEKRFSHGLQFLSTYTFSKSIDSASGSPVTGGGDSNSSNFMQNPFDWNADRALSSFDVRNKFVMAFNYNLPFGRGQAMGRQWNRAVDILLGGWQVNGILTAQSGLPFSVFATSSAQCGCSSGGLRAELIGNPFPSGFHQSVQQWFDPAAFSDPPPEQYGNSGRNIIPGPGLTDLDFSLFKKFKVDEKRIFQLRAEYFNILNHSNFLYPTSTTDATWNTGGILTQAMPARVGQLALKFSF